VRPAAEGCDVLVATGLVVAAAATRTAAEELGLPYVFVSYFPSYLPSPHHPPLAWPGHPLPAGETDNRVLWQHNAEVLEELFGRPVNEPRATRGLPAVDDLRGYFLTGRPWLAADEVLAPWLPADGLETVPTGAFRRPDSRPLPAALEEFLT